MCNIFFVLFLGLCNLRLMLAIDILPCTEILTAADMGLAQRILQDATPPGYTLVNHEPIVGIGRRPHRWISTFTRNDNYYSCGCAYLTRVKQEFLGLQPQGSAISKVQVKTNPLNPTPKIEVEYIVYCECRKVPSRRRKRSLFSSLLDNERECISVEPYKKEETTCPGT